MLKKILLAGAVVLGGAGGAQAADVMDTVPVADWTGFYAGIHGGYGWGNFDYDARLSTIVEGGEDVVNLGHDGDADGFFAGVQAGYNWQMDSFLLGVEGDVSKSWIGSDSNRDFVNTDLDTGTIRTDTDLDWMGTLRLRAGFLATDALLIYGTGGLAWGNVDSQVRFDLDGDGTTDLSGSDSGTRLGWTLGGGLEYKMSEALSVKAEYLYIDLGDEDVIHRDLLGGSVRASNDVSVHTVRAGLNFHF